MANNLRIIVVRENNLMPIFGLTPLHFSFSNSNNLEILNFQVKGNGKYEFELTSGASYDFTVSAPGFQTTSPTSTGVLSGTITEVTATALYPIDSNQYINLTVGGGATMSALRADGTVWSWGHNDSYEVGDGTIEDQGSPVQLLGPSGVGYMTDVVEVQQIGETGAVLKTDGTVWCWGHGLAGQCGQQVFALEPYPVQVVGPDGTGVLNNIVRIMGGGGCEHFIALRNDGVAFGWGMNQMGQYDATDTTQPNWYKPHYIRDSNGNIRTNIVDIAAGGEYSMFLKDDGTVAAMGWNYRGQLGSATEVNPGVDLRMLVYDNVLDYNLEPLSDVIKILAGGQTSLAIKKDGTVWAWGNGDYDNDDFSILGTGSAKNSSVAIRVFLGFDVKDIYSGSLSSAFLDKNGRIWTTGMNYNITNLGVSFFPIMVEGAGDIVQLGGTHNAQHCLRSDGTIQSWGDRMFGQIGDGGSFSGSQETPTNYDSSATDISMFLNSYFVHDTSNFYDYTTETRSASADTVTLGYTVSGSEAYFGNLYRFGYLNITVTTPATSGEVVWEYWNGLAWEALSNVVDNTNSFTVAGSGDITFTVPKDWSQYILPNTPQAPNSSLFTNNYWIRARMTTPFDVSPKGSLIVHDVNPKVQEFLYNLRFKVISDIYSPITNLSPGDLTVLDNLYALIHSQPDGYYLAMINATSSYLNIDTTFGLFPETTGFNILNDGKLIDVSSTALRASYLPISQVYLTDEGLTISDITWDLCKDRKMSTVSTVGSTLLELGSGIYILVNPNILDDTFFKISVTGQPTKFATGVFSKLGLYSNRIEWQAINYGKKTVM